MRTLLLLGLPAALAGCASLDGFAWNAIHCSEVGQDTCTAYDNPWDNVCLTCEQPYDWQKEYTWHEGTLEPGQSVRPIPASAVTQLTLESTDGEAQLDAYWIVGHGGDPAVSGVTMVYNHGNYANLEHYAPRVRFLYEAGYSVLAWDYRGYGKTMPETTPTAEQHFADSRLVLEEALARAPNPDKVVIYGMSIGSLAATEMADQDTACALILEAPFTSISRTTEANTTVSLPEQFVSSGAWDNYRRLEGHTGPILAMTGDADTSFRPEDIEDLVNQTSGHKDVWIVEGAEHGLATPGVPDTAGLTPYMDRMKSFLGDAGCL